MNIIVQGSQIDTKDIWDIELLNNSREICVIIKLIDKDNIHIGRSIDYETHSYEMNGIKKPYERLYNEVKEKWESDKTELEIFKL